MALAPSLHSMVPQAPCLPSAVHSGEIQTESRITLSTVRSFPSSSTKVRRSSSVPGWTGDQKNRAIVAFSSLPTVQVRLPAGQANTSVLSLSASIRDRLDCLTEVTLSSVVVVADSSEINNFVRSVLVSASTNNTLSQVLASGNQNAVGQVISLLSQQFNQNNTRTGQVSIAVSSLGTQAQPAVSDDRN